MIQLTQMNDTVTKLLDYAEGYARAHTYGTSSERHAARQALQDELAKVCADAAAYHALNAELDKQMRGSDD